MSTLSSISLSLPPSLSLSLSLSQDEYTFIISHFTGERYYTISDEWIQANSTHLPPSNQVLQSLLSSSNDLLCLLAQVLVQPLVTSYTFSRFFSRLECVSVLS